MQYYKPYFCNSVTNVDMANTGACGTFITNHFYIKNGILNSAMPPKTQ